MMYTLCGDRRSASELKLWIFWLLFSFLKINPKARMIMAALNRMLNNFLFFWLKEWMVFYNVKKSMVNSKLRNWQHSYKCSVLQAKYQPFRPKPSFKMVNIAAGC